MQQEPLEATVVDPDDPTTFSNPMYQTFSEISLNSNMQPSEKDLPSLESTANPVSSLDAAQDSTVSKLATKEVISIQNGHGFDPTPVDTDNDTQNMLVQSKDK